MGCFFGATICTASNRKDERGTRLRRPLFPRFLIVAEKKYPIGLPGAATSALSVFFRYGMKILVAAPGEVDQHGLVFPERRQQTEGVR